ncbi:unnamed protein product, partial [Ectocarpus sp. 8 AP-2014]
KEARERPLPASPQQHQNLNSPSAPPHPTSPHTSRDGRAASHRSYRRRHGYWCSCRFTSTMCICKRSSPKSNTTRTINKNMPPPPPTPPRHASAHDNRGRRSPTATPRAAAHEGAGASRQAPAVSMDQISSILDPFFVDTCQFFKQSSPPPRQQAPAATVGTTTN